MYSLPQYGCVNELLPTLMRCAEQVPQLLFGAEVESEARTTSFSPGPGLSLCSMF